MEGMTSAHRQESTPQLKAQQPLPRHVLNSPKQPDDRHARYVCLMAAAERASETLERLLAVTRLGLSLTVDMMRLSDDSEDAPPSVLGFHRLSTRTLGSAADVRQEEDSLCYKLQEICAYDTATQFVAAAPATSAEEVALLRLRIAPRTSYKSGGLLSKGLITVQVDLTGSAVVRLTSHAEDYVMQLPGIDLEAPLSATCRPKLRGFLEVHCAATGLGASISFLPKRQVDGSVNRLQGQGSARMARITGTLYGADDRHLPFCSVINLQVLQPMQTPYIWKSVQDALFRGPTKQAGTSKKSDALWQQLVDYLRGDASNVVAIPPCIEAERAAGKSLRYELQYVITRPET